MYAESLTQEAYEGVKQLKMVLDFYPSYLWR